MTCIYYNYYAVAVDSSRLAGYGETAARKVDINNAPLVDVTLVMLMPSEDVYFYKYYSVSGLKQASRLMEMTAAAEGGYK